MSNVDDTSIIIENDMEHYRIVSLDRPCEFCKVLNLDDAGHGGTIKYNQDGRPFVDFGQVQETPAQRYGENIFKALYGTFEYYKPRTWFRLDLKLGYERVDTLPGLPGFASTESQGCAFCSMLRGDILSNWDKLKGEIGQVVEDEKKAYQAKLIITGMSYRLCENHHFENRYGFGAKDWAYLDSLHVFFTIDGGSVRNDYFLHYNISADENDQCASWFRIPRRPLPSEYLSPLSIERLNGFINKSLSETPVSIKQNHYPTRLLDVGSSTCSEQLRLVISAEHFILQDETNPAMRRYAALSYCWGSEDEAKSQLKTTRNTIQAHLSHINFGDLPQTVADAVQVCRSLGIRYLWVDALCIVQDDSDDWAKESFEMSNIFSHSFLTLCILQGSSCLSGFLKRPRAQQALQINFLSTLDNSVSGKLYLSMLESPEENIKNIKSMIQPVNFGCDEPAGADLRNAAWETRGWTFQEAWLSPRKLFFGQLMFHFSCGNLHESADGTKFQGDEPLFRDEMNFSTIMEKWYRMVTVYGNRKLTYENDRFPALSAFARIISEKFPDQQYLAGLWKSDLHRGLLWTPHSWTNIQDYLKPPGGVYVAPSWSWAHCPCSLVWFQGVNTNLFPHSPEFELKDVNIVVEDLNPYGRVSSGTLDLLAKVFPFSLSEGRIHMIETPRSERRFLGVVFHNTLLSEKNEYIASLHLDWITLGQKQHPEDSLGDRFWMILISRSSLNNIYNHWYPSKDKRISDPEIVCGLLLVQNNEKEEYQKVGLWYSETRGLGGRKFWDNIPKRLIRLV
ncbi:HET-domain-containing protein [Annulohypoxylon stygium]|nr:HET-domain-containing protein [Annulohypoxylon stygium]